MLTHLGVWAMRAHALPGEPETVRDAAERILRHLRRIENNGDRSQIELLRTNRNVGLPMHPLLKRPPQRD